MQITLHVTVKSIILVAVTRAEIKVKLPGSTSIAELKRRYRKLHVWPNVSGVVKKGGEDQMKLNVNEVLRKTETQQSNGILRKQP